MYNCGGALKTLIDNIAKWREHQGFISGWGNVPEKLMLTVTEISEAMEAYRMIPLEQTCSCSTRPTCAADNRFLVNFREELADTAIRLFDIASSCNIDLEAEIERKMLINEERPHKHGKTC